MDKISRLENNWCVEGYGMIMSNGRTNDLSYGLRPIVSIILSDSGYVLKPNSEGENSKFKLEKI